MRYRIEEFGDPAASVPSEGVFTGSAVYTLFIGLAFVAAGLRGRQYWLVSVGAILAVASAIYLAFEAG
ncbi:MAG: hypothetical protein HKO62_10310 [Gammaproteobacteria bacterium]|nr:hypothetical protein [Gammaproteobacteria bacterium]